MGKRSPNIFYLRAIDPTTRSIALEVRFEVANRDELRALLGMPKHELSAGAHYDLDKNCVTLIAEHYGFSFQTDSMQVSLEPWHPVDDLPYKVHHRRELALMLAGVKPLSVFMGLHPNPKVLDAIPEREFEPYVTSGRIVKRVNTEVLDLDASKTQAQRTGSRSVLYALVGEEWRIDAYLLLRKTASISGWNEGFERMEGSLLGYEDWQNDINIERFRKHQRNASAGAKSAVQKPSKS